MQQQKASAVSEIIVIGADNAAKKGADQLVEIAKNQCHLFHDANRETYGSFQSNDHFETWPLNSSGFRHWLGNEYFRQHGKVAKDSTLNDAIQTLVGTALFAGLRDQVFMRIGYNSENYYIDLCNDAWQAVCVNKNGWEIVDGRAIKFIRNANMKSLPTPKKTHGALDKLWEIVNIPLNHRRLVLAWILECFRPEFPFVILEITGEQGSAKSTTQKYLRRLIDPNRVDLRSAPKDREDLFVAANNSWLQSYNNLSYITPLMQDAFCVMSTGGGIAGRTLYTNAEETVVETMHPVVMNGISTLATAQDLLDRVINILPDRVSVRKTEMEIEECFNLHKSGIFGELLSLFSRTLYQLPNVTLANPPRMADFAHLGAAMYRALKVENPEMSFLTEYDQAMVDNVNRALDGSTVANTIRKHLIQNPQGIESTMQRMFEAMKSHCEPGETFPQTARGFGDALRRVAPGLRKIGIDIEFLPRKADGIWVRLKTRT